MPASVAIGDLDGDEVPDLAVANYDSDNVSVLLGVGDGTFAAAANYTVDPYPRSVAIGDLDGDRVPDLVVASAFSANVAALGGNVAVLLGVGDGTFVGRANYAAGNSPKSVAIGDLDGDQVPDLAVASIGAFPFHDGIVSVLLGVGDGTFAAAEPYAVGDDPGSVAIGDLDGDQVPDLVVANDSSDNISVLMGVGDGTFAAPVNYAAGALPRTVVIGDFDGDQVPDLAVATNPRSAAITCRCMLGVGDGTFAAAVTLRRRRDQAALSVAIGDLNGDQVPDLAVANYGSYPEYDGKLSVLLGVGDGTFAAAVHYAVGSSASGHVSDRRPGRRPGGRPGSGEQWVPRI